jgi:SpoVK/Ycf46/Vps4 family AAA+-type ATPase
VQGAILFVDEVDAVFSARASHAKSSVSHVLDSLLSTFLKFLEGMQGATGTTVILATNRPQVLDAALLSRCGAVVEFPLPNARQRAAIWALYAKQFHSTQATRQSEASQASTSHAASAAAAVPSESTSCGKAAESTSALAQLVAASRGLSGRDIRRVSELVERRHVGSWLRRKEAAEAKDSRAGGPMPAADEASASPPGAGVSVPPPPLSLYLQALEERREGVLGDASERQSGPVGGSGRYGPGVLGDDDNDDDTSEGEVSETARSRRKAAGVGV